MKFIKYYVCVLLLHCAFILPAQQDNKENEQIVSFLPYKNDEQKRALLRALKDRYLKKVASLPYVQKLITESTDLPTELNAIIHSYLTVSDAAIVHVLKMLQRATTKKWVHTIVEPVLPTIATLIDEEGTPVLHKSVAYNGSNPAVVNLLIENKADVLDRNRQEQLAVACINYSTTQEPLSIRQLLYAHMTEKRLVFLEKGGTTTTDAALDERLFFNCLHYSNGITVPEHWPVYRYLPFISKKTLNKRGGDSARCPLEYALSDEKLLRVIHEKGAISDIQDDDGNTILHHLVTKLSDRCPLFFTQYQSWFKDYCQDMTNFTTVCKPNPFVTNKHKYTAYALLKRTHAKLLKNHEYRPHGHRGIRSTQEDAEAVLQLLHTYQEQWINEHKVKA